MAAPAAAAALVQGASGGLGTALVRQLLELRTARTGTLIALILVGCASPSGVVPRGFPAEALPIDLSRFMGDWYVLAHIPTAPEAEAHAAIESYALQPDGTIDVRFRFCEGSLDGAPRELEMTAWVVDPDTNAEWRVRPFWPLRLVYRIHELDPGYGRTVIVNPNGYAWLMARSPELSDAAYRAFASQLEGLGYDTGSLRRIPHGGSSCHGAH